MLNRLKKGASDLRASATRENRSASSSDDHMTSDQQSGAGFLCPICKLAFGSPEELTVHFETHSNAEVNENNHDFAQKTAIAPSSQGSEDGSNGQHKKVMGSFMCPQCMQDLESADELQIHFNAMHETLYGNRDGDALAMRMELNDLRTSLKEEKWYSTELKKELDKLQQQLSNKIQAMHVPDARGGDEVSYYLQQIQALEAGKALVTTRMLELDKQTNDYKRANETLRREKDRIIEKTAAMSKDYTALKSQWDEEMSQKIALGEEVLLFRDRCMALKIQLDQRPSEDDVAVLRKELVHAQTAFDSMTRDKESEIDLYRNQYEELAQKYADQSSAMKSLKAQLNSAPKDDVVQELTGRCEQLQQNLSAKEDQLKLLEARCEELQTSNENATSEIERLESEIYAVKLRSEELESAQSTLNSALKEKDELLNTNASQINQLSHDFSKATEALNSTADSSKSILSEKQKRIDDLEADIRNLRSELATVGNRLSETNEQLSVAERNLTEQTTAKENTMKDHGELTKQLANVTYELNKSQEEISHLNNEIKQFKEAEQHYRQEHQVLLGKIEQGEGQNEAIKQLSAEKASLQTKIDDLQSQCNDSRKLVEDLKANSHRELSDVKSKISSAENERNQLAQSLQKESEAVAVLKEKLVAAEKLASEKTNDYENQLKVLRTGLSSKENELSAQRAQIEKLQSDLKDRTQTIEAQENSKKQQQDQLKSVMQQLQDKEKQLKLLQADCTQKSEQIEDLNKQLKNHQKNVSELQQKFEDLKISSGKRETELSERLAISENLIKNQSSENSELAEKLRETKLECEKSAQENSSLRNQIETALVDIKNLQNQESEVQNVVSKLKSDLALAEEKMQEKEKQLGDLSAQVEISEAEAKRTYAEKQKLETEYQTKINECQENSQKIHEMQSESATDKKTIGELQQKMEDLKEKMNQLEHDLSASATKVKNFEQNIEEMTNSIEAKNTTLNAVNTELNDLKNDFSQVKVECEKLREEKENLQHNLLERDRAFEGQSATRISLESKISTFSDEIEGMKLSHTSEISQYETQIRVLKEKKIELDKELDSCRKDVDEKAAENFKLTKELEQTRNEFANSLKDLRLACDNEKSARTVAESTLAEKEKTLSAQNEMLSDRLNTAIEDSLQLKKKLEVAVSENSKFKEEIQGLQQQSAAWQEEKRAIVERCLSMENDLENERDKGQFMKRKYDDAISAMHELGRENQTLQIDISKQYNRRWQDDAEAVNCTACGKAFSVTVRKHHCRNCGSIFCNDCSSKQTMVASAKKAVRVCENCYVELKAR